MAFSQCQPITGVHSTEFFIVFMSKRGHLSIHRDVDTILGPLSIIFQILGFLDFPVNWKLENLVPVFKKGKKKDAANYRPVSLTSVRLNFPESYSRSYEKLCKTAKR